MENLDLTFAFYNLENLFLPTIDNPYFGPKKWTKERYNIKLRRIVEVLEIIKQKKQNLPVILGVCEIQGKQPLDDLLIFPLLSEYDFIYSKSLDDRGMDTAILFNKKKINILEIQHYSSENTRNILYCKMIFQGKILHTYTLHLPSKRNMDENQHQRSLILSKLKNIIRENLQKSEEFVVILGDFNLNPNDPSILELIDIKEDYKLYNPFSELYGKHIFSTFYRNRGLLFDQMIISKNFLDKTSDLQLKNAEVFISDALKKHGKPFRTFAGSRYLGGYSDHYPVMITLENIKNSI